MAGKTTKNKDNKDHINSTSSQDIWLLDSHKNERRFGAKT